jgi:hypothetical protein
MEQSVINHLEEFLSDVGFPIDKSGLVEEAYEFPLPNNVREAIALLPDRDYLSREEVKRELIDIPFDEGVPKKDLEDQEIEDEDIDDRMDDESAVAIDEFTQMGDQENHESV